MARRGSGGDNDKRGGWKPQIGNDDPPKKGGKGGRAPNEYEQVDRGALTCGTCKGSGYVQTENLQVHSDGDAFSDVTDKKCGTCGGTGKIK